MTNNETGQAATNEAAEAEAAAQAQAEAEERRLDRIYDRYGDTVQGDALTSMAVAAEMNANALFEQGLPDKSEVEYDRAERLRSDGTFLLHLAGQEAPIQQEVPVQSQL